MLHVETCNEAAGQRSTLAHFSPDPPLQRTAKVRPYLRGTSEREAHLWKATGKALMYHEGHSLSTCPPISPGGSATKTAKPSTLQRLPIPLRLVRSCGRVGRQASWRQISSNL